MKKSKSNLLAIAFNDGQPLSVRYEAVRELQLRFKIWKYQRHMRKKQMKLNITEK